MEREPGARFAVPQFMASRKPLREKLWLVCLHSCLSFLVSLNGGMDNGLVAALAKCFELLATNIGHFILHGHRHSSRF